jgi:hypothetical protein
MCQLRSKGLRISIPAAVAPPDEPSTCCVETAQPYAEKIHLGGDKAYVAVTMIVYLS